MNKKLEVIKNIFSILILGFLLSYNSAFGKSYFVGNTKTYKSPNDLYIANVVKDSDSIYIDEGTYRATASLAVWTQNKLFIKGAGFDKVKLYADGKYIYGKGIWVFAGNNITVENIAFYNATVPDLNGAGIRLDGISLNVKSCKFVNNENGILTNNASSGDIVIENSEFDQGGAGDGYSHNLYIGHCNSLTFQYNYSHHAKVGHLLKSRANKNIIRYNRIMDEESGNSSRIIDLPNGGIAVIVGNLFMQGKNAENGNLIGYGLEGLSNGIPHELYCNHNTMVNKRTQGCTFLHIQAGASIAQITNNLYIGTGTLINGTATTNAGNVQIEDINKAPFKNEASYDYNLTLPNSLVDNAVSVEDKSALGLTPTLHYVHPRSSDKRTMTGVKNDIGAYEFKAVSPTIDYQKTTLILYPNPTTSTFETINNKNKIVTLFDMNGRLLFTSKNNGAVVDLSTFTSGVYLVKVGDKFGKIVKL
jgi:hypothetical protein